MYWWVKTVFFSTKYFITWGLRFFISTTIWSPDCFIYWVLFSFAVICFACNGHYKEAVLLWRCLSHLEGVYGTLDNLINCVLFELYSDLLCPGPTGGDHNKVVFFLNMAIKRGGLNCRLWMVKTLAVIGVYQMVTAVY